MMELAPRGLASGLCTSDLPFDVGFNNDEDVPPYVGYMFEMTALTDIELTSFELDVRLDLIPPDLFVELYEIAGSYDLVMDKPDAWTRLASTNLVPQPNGYSAMIPDEDFTPLQMTSGEKKSFYITMKGPYLDHTVHGLQKQGDVQIKGDDMQLQVGSGFTSYGFPGIADPILSPQFAGIVHYKKVAACNDDSVTTDTIADFPFLFAVNELDDKLLSTVRSAIEEVIGNILESNEVMRVFANEFGLRTISVVSTDRVSNPESCPSNWLVCPPMYLNTQIVFNHQPDLESGAVLFELYKHTSQSIDAVVRSVAGSLQAMYLGYESVEVGFSAKIVGVPTGTEMDNDQTDHFEEASQRLLSSLSSEIAVFGVHVDSQHVLESPGILRRRLGGESVNFVRGTLQGAIPHGMNMSDFDREIEEAFKDKAATYLSFLTNDESKPGEAKIGDLRGYFRGVAEVVSTVDDMPVAANATMPPMDTSRHSTANLSLPTEILVAVVVVVALLLLCFWRRQRRQKNLEDSLRSAREEKRIARFQRNLRQLKAKSAHEVDRASPPLQPIKRQMATTKSSPCLQTQKCVETLPQRKSCPPRLRDETKCGSPHSSMELRRSDPVASSRKADQTAGTHRASFSTASPVSHPRPRKSISQNAPSPRSREFDRVDSTLPKSPKAPRRKLESPANSPGLYMESEQSNPTSPSPTRTKPGICVEHRSSLHHPPTSPSPVGNATSRNASGQQGSPKVAAPRVVSPTVSPNFNGAKHGTASPRSVAWEHPANQSPLPASPNGEAPTPLSKARHTSIPPKSPLRRLVTSSSQPNLRGGTTRGGGGDSLRASSPTQRGSFSSSPSTLGGYSPKLMEPQCRRATVVNGPLSPRDSPRTNLAHRTSMAASSPLGISEQSMRNVPRRRSAGPRHQSPRAASQQRATVARSSSALTARRNTVASLPSLPFAVERD